jgi:hypothetical protein
LSTPATSTSSSSSAMSRSSLRRASLRRHLHHRVPLGPLVSTTYPQPPCGSWPSRHGCGLSSAFSPSHRAAALMLVMPAIEPGWDAFLQVSSPSSPSAQPASRPSLSRFLYRSPSRRRRAHVRAFLHVRASVHPSTRARARKTRNIPIFPSLAVLAELAGFPPASCGKAVGETVCSGCERRVCLVHAHVCAPLSRAASPAVVIPGCATKLACVSRASSRASVTSPSRISRPRFPFFLAKRSLWGTHNSPWDVSPSRRPLPSSARLSCVVVPFRPGIEHLVCRPKKPRGFCCTRC